MTYNVFGGTLKLAQLNSRRGVVGTGRDFAGDTVFFTA